MPRLNDSRTKTTNTIKNKRLKYRTRLYRCILFAMSLAAIVTNAVAAPAASAGTTATFTTIAASQGNSNNSSSSSIALPITTTTTTIITTEMSHDNAPPTTHTRLRKRHSKRHSNWYDYANFNENSTALEWANPCGGFYMPTDVALGTVVGLMKRKHPKQIYNILKKSANNEHKTLKGSQLDIDISNIQIWFLHNYTYKFLPKLKENSSIALKRWYRNMQTYVASFAYLRRTQLKWDHSKSQRESRIARELKHLLASSRRMLCELESAVNNTHPYQRLSSPLPQITRPQMNKRLKLRTKRRAERNAAGAVLEADAIDLQFVKYYYFEYLETMWKVLRKITKRKGQIAIATQPKEFNEIEKPAAAASSSSSSSKVAIGSDVAGSTSTRRTVTKKKKNPRNRKNKRMGSRRATTTQLQTRS